MIPKVIHYCWFSGDPYPVEIKKCMDTWKKILPDFTLRIWKLEDALSLNYNYVYEALKCRNWTYAADVVRLYALYTEGGVYMDSDIFLKKRFDEYMNFAEFVTFHECSPNSFLEEVVYTKDQEVPYGLQAAFMIGLKGNTFCKLVLDYYKSQHFVNEDGSKNERIAPFIYAEIAESLGFKYINEKQILDKTTAILESKYLACTKRDVTPLTFGVHRISHSWKNFNDYPLLKRIEKRTKHYYRVMKYNLFKC